MGEERVCEIIESERKWPSLPFDGAKRQPPPVSLLPSGLCFFCRKQQPAVADHDTEDRNHESGGRPFHQLFVLLGCPVDDADEGGEKDSSDCADEALQGKADENQDTHRDKNIAFHGTGL